MFSSLRKRVDRRDDCGDGERGESEAKHRLAKMVGRRPWGRATSEHEAGQSKTQIDTQSVPAPATGSKIQSGILWPAQVHVEIPPGQTQPALAAVVKPWSSIENLTIVINDLLTRVRRKKRTSGERILPPQPFTSAVSIKDGQGEMHSVLMVYDTLSTDNCASQKFVDQHHLRARPLFPDNLKTYDTATGDYVPTHYVEVLLRDTNHNIPEFKKVVFNIWPRCAGYAIVGGLGFIHEHRIVLDSTQPRDCYVNVGRKADAAARKKQEKICEQAEKDSQYAKALLSNSTAESSTAGTVQSDKKHVAGSSQTSTRSAPQTGSPEKS